METPNSPEPQQRCTITSAEIPLLPTAVGVLALQDPLAEADRRQARLVVALAAYELGYFLLDVIEVPAGIGGPGYDWIESLASRTDADALLVSGPVDHGLLGGIARRIRMVIRPV